MFVGFGKAKVTGTAGQLRWNGGDLFCEEVGLEMKATAPGAWL